MSLFTRKVLLQAFSPSTQTKRFRGKINIQKPKAPHFERALFFEVAKPFFPSRKKDPNYVEICQKGVKFWQKDEAENPFQKFVARELRERLEKSKLVAFYHCNPLTAEVQNRATLMFHKNGMFLKNYGRKTLEMAVKDSRFECLLEFYISRNMTVFSEEGNIKKLLSVNKKFPQLVLLAGIYENRLLNKDELVYFSQIPNLESAQAALVQTLQSVGGQLVSHLQSHPSNLVAQLGERAKQLEEEKS